MASTDTLQKFLLPFSEDDEKRLASLAGNSKLLLGAIKSLLLTNTVSYDELASELQAGAAQNELEVQLLRRALGSLSVGEYVPLYALCVVLSQATEPLSEKELDAVWKSIPFPEPYPDGEDLLLMLLRLNFVELSTKSSAPKFQLYSAVKAEILRRLSQEDCTSANLAFAQFYSNQTGNDDTRCPNGNIT